MSVVHVTDTDFDEHVLASSTPVLVDFWGQWCPPCKTIAPILDELAPKYLGKALIAKFNVDENTNVAARYGVTALPTLIVFKGGMIVDRVVGAKSRGDLQKLIERNL